MKWADLSSDVFVTDAWIPDVRPETASENPALFKSIMQLSVKAGAQILRAPSAEAIRLCREVGPEHSVWAVLGSSGKILQLQEIEPGELAQWYVECAQQLLRAKPDALLLQGQTDLEEARVATAALKREIDVPLGVTLSFGSGADDVDTVMGQSCEDAAAVLTEAGADLVGSYGILNIDRMVLVIRLMREKTKLPLLACPEAGQKELDGEHIVYREEPDIFASKIESLIAAGASVIGAADGVGPEHIKAAVAALSD